MQRRRIQSLGSVLGLVVVAGAVAQFGGVSAQQSTASDPFSTATVAPYATERDAVGIALGSTGMSGRIVDEAGALYEVSVTNGTASLSKVAGAKWAGQDIARSISVRSDGTSGWILDRSGGMHAFGGAPAVKVAAYWASQDVARDAAILDAATGSGYVVDKQGGIHAFGGAPAARGTWYVPGADAARAIVLLANGTGGYVLDRTGGMHPFAVGQGAMPPALKGASWPDRDIARDMVARPDGSFAVLDSAGGLHSATTTGVKVPLPHVGGYSMSPADSVALGTNGEGRLAIVHAAGGRTFASASGEASTGGTTAGGGASGGGSTSTGTGHGGGATTGTGTTGSTTSSGSSGETGSDPSEEPRPHVSMSRSVLVGTARPGRSLTCRTNMVVRNVDDLEIRYFFERNGKTLPASKRTYRLTQADAGTQFACRVLVKTEGGSTWVSQKSATRRVARK